MNKFASPGIDSSPAEVGVYNSGAGLHPNQPTTKARPYDMRSNNPAIEHNTEHLIAGYPETKAPDASTLRIRRRGFSPWQGAFPGRRPNAHSMYNSGGSVDTNAGASSHIAGGAGAAASLVRLNGAKKANEGQKLPVLPKQIVRGGNAPLPAGGAVGPSVGSPVPLTAQVMGFPSVIKVLANPGAKK